MLERIEGKEKLPSQNQTKDYTRPDTHNPNDQEVGGSKDVKSKDPDRTMADISNDSMEGGKGKQKEMEAIDDKVQPIVRDLPGDREGSQASEFLESIKKEGRGSTTVDSAAFREAQKMVDKWKEEKLPGANKVTAEMILKNYPRLKWDGKIERDINFEEARLDQLSNVLKDTQIVYREFGGKLHDLEKQRANLQESFPKNPSEVLLMERARPFLEHSKQAVYSTQRSFDDMAKRVFRDAFR